MKTFIYNVRKWFLCVMMLFIASTVSAKAKTYLVCVGVNNSKVPGCAYLSQPLSDAKNIKWVYEQNGNVEVVMLTNEQATVSNVEKTVNELYPKAKKGDAVVFFFSGHGGPGHFICYDKELDYDVIINAMAKSKAKRKIIFGNACYSGDMAHSAGNNKSQSNASAKDKKEKAKKKKQKTGVMLFLSSRDNETTLGTAFMVNSLFPAYLQNGLKGSADFNDDRVITAKELFDFVSKGVIKASENQQHPYMMGKFDDNMVIMEW